MSTDEGRASAFGRLARTTTDLSVMLAQTGIHDARSWHRDMTWVHAFAGMTSNGDVRI
ncbi:MAG: hypothetical protein AB7E81_15335 [Hyphomicrobiaceae bacterium]